MENTNTNRLLAMLNSASSPPPNPAPVTSSPNQSHSLSAGLGGSNGSISPREPSPFPPPPSLQAVSLQDLFKNITPTPSPGAAPLTALSGGHATSNPGPKPATTGGGNEQANKLLGMLKGFGSPPPSGPSGPAGQGISTPGMDPAIVGSGPSTPFGVGEAGRGTVEAKSPSKASEPVITHPQPPSPPSHPPIPAHPTQTTATSPKASNSPFAPHPAQPTPPPSSGPPKKSIFDFVSPFDVFDAPKTKPTPPLTTNKNEAKSRVASVAGASAPKGVKDKGETIPPVPAKSTVPHAQPSAPPSGVRAASPSKATGAPRAVAGPTSSTASPTAPSAPHPVSTSSSTAPPAPRAGSLDERLPYLVKKVIGNATGQGPKRLSGSTSIRLDKPDLDALVSDKDAVRVVPFAKLNTDVGEWHHGRTVGLTPGWVAYALHKGRVRLMDRTSGAKLVLQLPSAASSTGTIIDIATTPTRVAVIGPNHSITVWSVPSSWTSDDPPTEEIAHITPDSAELGLPERIEWIQRNDQDCLVIGGSGGVVIAELNGHQEFLSQIVDGTKVLITDGPAVSFSINSLGQAIALLSSTNHLSIYNISTLNRVWHRRVPSSTSAADEGEPSSVQFCESMLLIGRSHDTIFDLVQITTNLSVLFTIDFQIPPPGFSTLHFGRATYDHTNRILWVSQFARGSLYAFHFDLAGKPPVKVSAGETVVAFDRMAEYSLDSVTTMVLEAGASGGAVEMFYATPAGVSLATISKEAIAALAEPEEASAEQENGAPREVIEKREQQAPALAKNDSTDSKKSKGMPGQKVTANVKSPAPAPTGVLDEAPVQVKEEKVTPEKRSLPPAQLAGGDEELQKTLKKMEDRMVTQFRQALSQQIGQVTTRIDGLANGALANDIASKVDKAIKASVATAVQNEIKKTAIPAITSAIQAEMSSVASQKIPAAVSQSLRDMPAVIEKALGPVIQRGVAVTVMQAMDKSISDAMQRTIIPTTSGTVDHTVGTISKEIRGELLQIRKDLSPIRESSAPSSELLIRDLTAAVAQLQKQVSDLSASLPRAGQAGPSHVLLQMSNGPSGSGHGQFSPSAPPPQALPSPSQLEEVFLGALSQVSTPATVGLINEHGGMTDYILPLGPGARSPLTQAILLTLLHRISLALVEIPPTDPTFGRAVAWERRVAQLLDPRDPDTAQFWGRIIPMVQSGLAGVLGSMGARFGGDPGLQRQMGELRGVLEVLASKA